MGLIKEVRAKVLKTMLPPPDLTVTQWADAKLRLSPEDSAEPGQYRSDRAPYQKGIMDSVSDRKVAEVVIQSSAQIGKTLITKAVIGYHIDQDPAPMLMVQPTVDMAKTFSKDRLAPMVRDTPALRDKIADPRSRDSGNTVLQKQFPGGHITLAGANAPAGLASRPIRIVLFDEVDRFPLSAGSEGDPISLGRKRTATFWNRKIISVSTPTRKGLSRIEVAYENSDKRRYFVPCPHCDHFHTLEWANVGYPEGKPEEAWIACPECGGVITDAHKPRMLKRGEWRATAEFKGIAGFHLSELYSPWRTFADVAQDYELAKDHPEQLKTWTNTSLGEVYAEKGEAPEWQRLVDKREDYPIGRAPADVRFLTAGVDVQKDRLEMEIVGWCEGKRSYSVEYLVIMGDTEKTGDDGPWAKLRELIVTGQWDHESGALLPLRYTAIDSGYRTTLVYDFCRSVGMDRCAPIKGKDGQPMVISQPRPIDRKKDGKKAWRGLKLYTVGSSVVKSEIYGLLGLNKREDGSAPPGYCHFPQYEDRHFKELTSEQVHIRMVKGTPSPVWVTTPGVRNEPLDCRVYARAAAAIVGIDRYKEKDWKALDKKFGPVKKRKTKEAPAPEAPQEPVKEETPPPEPPKPAKRPPRKKRASYLEGSRLEGYL
ncbi:Phage terminase large subunit [compost metagenome]